MYLKPFGTPVYRIPTAGALLYRTHLSLSENISLKCTNYFAILPMKVAQVVTARKLVRTLLYTTIVRVLVYIMTLEVQWIGDAEV